MSDCWRPPRALSRPLSEAERNRLRRWREKNDMMHIHGLDVSLHTVAVLVELSYLDESQSEDRLAVRAAIERYLGETLLGRATSHKPH